MSGPAPPRGGRHAPSHSASFAQDDDDLDSLFAPSFPRAPTGPVFAARPDQPRVHPRPPPTRNHSVAGHLWPAPGGAGKPPLGAPGPVAPRSGAQGAVSTPAPGFDDWDPFGNGKGNGNSNGSSGSAGQGNGRGSEAKQDSPANRSADADASWDPFGTRLPYGSSAQPSLSSSSSSSPAGNDGAPDENPSLRGRSFSDLFEKALHSFGELVVSHNHGRGTKGFGSETGDGEDDEHEDGPVPVPAPAHAIPAPPALRVSPPASPPRAGPRSPPPAYSLPSLSLVSSSTASLAAPRRLADMFADLPDPAAPLPGPAPADPNLTSPGVIGSSDSPSAADEDDPFAGLPGTQAAVDQLELSIIQRASEEVARVNSLRRPSVAPASSELSSSPPPPPPPPQKSQPASIAPREMVARVRQEIIDTEARYLDNLKLIQAEFVEKLLKDKALTDGRPEFKLLHLIHPMIELHTVILRQLQVMDPGDVFFRLGDFLKMYTEYVNCYESFAQWLSAAPRENRRVRKLLKQCQPRLMNQSVMFFLVQPIQRIPRYVLLLKELIRQSQRLLPASAPPEAAAVDRNLELALQKCELVATHINEQKRQVENISVLLDIQNKLGNEVEIVRPHRRLIMEGRLEQQGRPVQVFLFNDVLVWSRLDSDRGSSVSGGGPGGEETGSAAGAVAAPSEVKQLPLDQVKRVTKAPRPQPSAVSPAVPQPPARTKVVEVWDTYRDEGRTEHLYYARRPSGPEDDASADTRWELPAVPDDGEDGEAAAADHEIWVMDVDRRVYTNRRTGEQRTTVPEIPPPQRRPGAVHSAGVRAAPGGRIPAAGAGAEEFDDLLRQPLKYSFTVHRKPEVRRQVVSASSPAAAAAPAGGPGLSPSSLSMGNIAAAAPVAAAAATTATGRPSSNESGAAAGSRLRSSISQPFGGVGLPPPPLAVAPVAAAAGGGEAAGIRPPVIFHCPDRGTQDRWAAAIGSLLREALAVNEQRRHTLQLMQRRTAAESIFDEWVQGLGGSPSQSSSGSSAASVGSSGSKM